MIKLTVLGNLGSDAELRKDAGQPFVSMSIAHTERRRDASGKEYEVTEWVSATLNGDGGNLLQYLKKGTKVIAMGDAALRLYHSEKERKMKAGFKLFIRSIELVGAMPDAVPSTLYDTDGVAHHIEKYYYCQDAQGRTLYDRGARAYSVAPEGWVTQSSPAPANPAQEATDVAEVPADVEPTQG